MKFSLGKRKKHSKKFANKTKTVLKNLYSSKTAQSKIRNETDDVEYPNSDDGVAQQLYGVTPSNEKDEDEEQNNEISPKTKEKEKKGGKNADKENSSKVINKGNKKDSRRRESAVKKKCFFFFLQIITEHSSCSTNQKQKKLEKLAETSEANSSNIGKNDKSKQGAENTIESSPPPPLPLQQRSQEQDETMSLPKVTKQPIRSATLSDLNKHTNEFFKHAKYLSASIQALKPLMNKSLTFKQEQVHNRMFLFVLAFFIINKINISMHIYNKYEKMTNYNELLKECKKVSEQFEKGISDLSNRVKHLMEEKKKSDDKVKAQFQTLHQRYEELAKKAATKDPVLAQENQSLKATLESYLLIIIIIFYQQEQVASLESELQEVKKQLQDCQEQNSQKDIEMEAQMSELRLRHTHELEIIAAKYKIEENRLEMKYRNLEIQMSDYKEEMKRKAREEATQTAIVIGQLERENDALKEEIQSLKSVPLLTFDFFF
ncbi:hypothetical protein RFI_10832 [Reticulomyxa filosa]|uniref:Uncharacterized protein n=1 Tax=Reticulomyxa filosa TaxID=46433 RepID=X6NLP6_RETFI|nr:hypothetical protein RFI_10832 [Reticulomyxa filosa]|eukprot:ETO26307.1 hypothetical protein RFI_10832 [Reticulomyxa filosa]